MAYPLVAPCGYWRSSEVFPRPRSCLLLLYPQVVRSLCVAPAISGPKLGPNRGPNPNGGLVDCFHLSGGTMILLVSIRRSRHFLVAQFLRLLNQQAELLNIYEHVQTVDTRRSFS